MEDELEEVVIKVVTNKKTVTALSRLIHTRAFATGGELDTSDIALAKIVKALDEGDSEVTLKLKREID